MTEAIRLIPADQANRDEAKQRILDALDVTRARVEAGEVEAMVMITLGGDTWEWSVKSGRVCETRLIGAMVKLIGIIDRGEA